MSKLYGSIEAGGTKFVCAVGDENFQILEKVQFPTTTPYETIEKTVAFFKKFEADLASVAIGSFGPIDIDQNSDTYGYITSTPKPNWANVDFVGLISKDFKIPFYFTTDVNSSAYGETIARSNVKSLLLEQALEQGLFKMANSLAVWDIRKLDTFTWLRIPMMFIMVL